MMNTRRWTVVALLLVFAASHAAAQLDERARARGMMTSVPFEYVGGRVLIHVVVDTSPPLTFIFDTGSSGTILGARIARRLGIQATDTVSRQGATGGFTVVRSPGHTVRVGSLELGGTTLAILDHEQLERAMGVRFDGVIGWELLSRYAVGLDFDARRLEVFDSRRFKPDAGAEALDIELRGRSPHINATITLDNGQRVSGWTLLDTGAPGSITVLAGFAREHKLLDGTPALCERRYRGAGPAFVPTRITMLQSLAVGGHDVASVSAAIEVGGPRAAQRAWAMGILGMEVLQRFNTVIDLQRGKVYLQPNRVQWEPAGADCSGLRLAMDSSFQRVLVEEVYDESPAAAAGLRTEDEIVQVDGRGASDLSLWDIRRTLARGTDVELVVKRGTETLKALLRGR